MHLFDSLEKSQPRMMPYRLRGPLGDLSCVREKETRDERVKRSKGRESRVLSSRRASRGRLSLGSCGDRFLSLTLASCKKRKKSREEKGGR